MRAQLVHRYQPSGYCNRTNAIRFCGAHIVGMIADQCHATLPADPSLAASAADGDPHQPGPISGEFRESPKPKILFQAGAFHLSPTDSRQVAGDQTNYYAPALQTLQHAP